MANTSDNTKRRRTKPACAIAGCENPSYTHAGFCRRHYHKLLRYGDPEGGRAGQKGDRLRWIETVAVPCQSDDCLTWPFCTNERGYAHFQKGSWQGYASRYVCILAHGEPADPAMQAAHSCGNGHLGCVNPRHLRWATPKENAMDSIAHGTHVAGQTHANAKLTDDDIRAIRSARGISQPALGRMYGVHQATISRILLGKGWNHVLGHVAET